MVQPKGLPILPSKELLPSAECVFQHFEDMPELLEQNKLLWIRTFAPAVPTIVDALPPALHTYGLWSFRSQLKCYVFKETSSPPSLLPPT